MEPYPPTNGPHYLEYYTDALTANGVDFDVYDVDARSRIAPDSLGVLGHYDAVVWYTGNDLLTREPGQPGGTGAATLANNEMLELRAYLNEGGRLLYTGRHAGWRTPTRSTTTRSRRRRTATTSIRPSTTAACCCPTTSCSTGWALSCSSRTAAPTRNWSRPLAGTALGAFDPGVDAQRRGQRRQPSPNIAWNDSVVPDDVESAKGRRLPQFSSDSFASWQTGVAGAFSPHTGSYYLYSDRSDQSYKRLMRTIDLTGVDAARAVVLCVVRHRADWDYMFVEAHTVGQDDWTTLPDRTATAEPGHWAVRIVPGGLAHRSEQ